jgi:hypothetical protein
MSVAEASESTDYSADPSQEQDPVATERDALDHEGPPGLGAEASDPIGITDPSSNPDPLDDPQHVRDAAAEAAAETADWFNEDVQKRAEFYGYEADRARAFGNREAFDLHIAEVDRLTAQWARGQAVPEKSAQEDQQAPQAQTQQVQQAQQQVQQAQQQLQAAIEKYKVELDPDYDPDALKNFNGMNDHYHKVISEVQAKNENYIRALAERQYAMESALQQYTGHQMAEETSRVERDMDTFFSGLGDEFKEAFGKSPTRMLAEGSPLRSARVAVWEEMNALREADAKLNRPACEFSQLQQRALRSLYGDKFKATARKEILNETKARQQTQIARPAGSQPKPKTGVDAAKKFVSAHPLMRSVREGSF